MRYLNLAFALLACVAAPAVAQIVQAEAPVLFEPGVISGPATDGAPTFSPDDRTLLFERTGARWSAIMESHLKGGRWARPVLTSFTGLLSDSQPSYAPDGTYVVYTSTRPLAATGGTQSGTETSIWRVDRTTSGWSMPRRLPETVNFGRRQFKPSLAANGDIYFMADTGTSGPPKWRIFVSRRAGDGYAKAEALPFSAPDSGDVDPYIAPDQSYLIFSSNSRRTPSDGHEHLYRVAREGSAWGPVTALRYKGDDLGADDGEAQVSPDGRRLFFTSNRSLPVDHARDRARMIADFANVELWDNSNGNVWSIALPPRG